jgi:phenylpyruvate tautomerase PptA (4-oxalocrotonate tautomerase family)
MPILDIELVQPDAARPPAAALTQALADAAGHALGAAPGRTWVRLRVLPATQYAENETAVAADELPAFATVLQTRPPQGEALDTEVERLTQALATCLGRDPQRVHVQYAPSAAGRQAFGGVLVR